MTAVVAQDNDLQGWRRAYAAGLFIGIFVMAATLGFVAAKGFALIGTFGGLLALPLVRPDRRAWVGLGLVVCLVAWALFSVSWSRYTPDFTIDSYKAVERLTSVKLVGQALLLSAMALAASRLPPRAAERALRVFAYGLTALAAMLVLDGVAKAEIYVQMRHLVGQTITPDLAMRNVARGGYVIAVMVWPASLLLRREGRNRLVVALALGVVASSTILGADAPSAALVVGVIALTAVLAWGRAAVLALGGFSAFYVLSAPWIVSVAVKAGLFERLKAHLPPSWDARLDIWSFADARILEQPLRGWGLDASRTWSPIIPLHTHDAAIQIWLELGLPGAVLVAAFVFFLFWAVSKATEGRAYMATASATITAYLTIGALSFGVWQEWWLAIGAVAFCACLALKRAIPIWNDEWDQSHSSQRPLQPL